jgi:hypothetical protein
LPAMAVPGLGCLASAADRVELGLSSPAAETSDGVASGVSGDLGPMLCGKPEMRLDVRSVSVVVEADEVVDGGVEGVAMFDMELRAPYMDARGRAERLESGPGLVMPAALGRWDAPEAPGRRLCAIALGGRGRVIGVMAGLA